MKKKINRRNSIKNGLHKPLINPTNGKLMIEDSPSPDSGHEQDLITFRSEGEALIQIQEKDPKNLEAISLFVQRHKNMSLPPWKNSNYFLRLCDLDGTDYMGQDYMQEAWEDLYLPKKTKMQVFGTLEYTQDVLHSVPCVILVGEDGCIYAYREEELQLIAKSLKEFVENGKSKVYKRYYYPDSSEEEDKSPPQDEEILKIRQRGRDFVNKGAPKFGAFLNSLPPRRESIKN
ncbi:ORF 6.5 [Frog virus 3]|uniref:ORF 6.5 n=1 Tax=Frog virus 3 TaxID=10493 RepID=A0A5B8P2K9_FRG3V|nr:ORF 6.5 [Frog virus 3]